MQVWIIRWNRAILWPDGVQSNMCCKTGTREEAEAYAKEIAEKYGLEIEAIA